MIFGKGADVLRSEPTCHLCGLREARRRFPEGALPLWECPCGMVFLHPHPVPEELARIYQSDYYESWGIHGEDEAKTRAMKRGTFKARLQRFAGTAAAGRVLDVGCATGYFLEVAQEAGWDVFGVELSRFAAEAAQQRFGSRVFNGTLEQARYPDGHFDLVTLSDLLEHVPDPRSFLLEVARVLVPGGAVMVVTPDVKSLTAKVMGSRWSHYKREHLYYFSGETLARLLEETGFRVLERRAAAKCLNVAYVTTQFRAYPHFLATPLFNLASALLPARAKNHNLSIRCGEMLIIATTTDRMPAR